MKKRKMSRLSKVVCAFFALITVGSMTMITAGAAGNYHDSVFTFKAEGTGWYVCGTTPREKWDATSAYVNNSGSNVDFSEVRVYGGDYIGADGTYFHQDFTARSPKYVAKGTSAYLPNYVNESGWKYADLVINLAHTNYTYSVYGLWSPDSI